MSRCKYWTPDCTEGGGIDEYCLSDEWGDCPTKEQTDHYDDEDRMVETEEEVLYNIENQ